MYLTCWPGHIVTRALLRLERTIHLFGGRGGRGREGGREGGRGGREGGRGGEGGGGEGGEGGRGGRDDCYTYSNRYVQ